MSEHAIFDSDVLLAARAAADRLPREIASRPLGVSFKVARGREKVVLKVEADVRLVDPAGLRHR